MARKATDHVTTIGIDVGKNNFHLIGLNGAGNIVLHRKLSRSQVIARLANLPPCLIGMEACAGAHHLSRQLQALGHHPLRGVDTPQEIFTLVDHGD
jgi:transposase